MERYDPRKIQEEVMQFWLENRIPDQIVNFDMKTLDVKRTKYYLLDGPPYVNGVPHVGHVKTTTTKDICSKFKTMQGHQCWWQPGFDCGGLPIEHAVEKNLGVKSKKDITERIGIDRFIAECKAMAEGNKSVWLDTYKQLGAWRGWLEPYMTYRNYYLESGWWTVKKMWEKGMLVEGEKPVFWCPRCETTLSGYEVTDSYTDITDFSIYVKFPLVDQEFTSIIIWTTTPWTLPANVAIAVHPDETYVKVKVRSEYLILAEKRLKDVMKDAEIEKYEIVEKMKGSSLAGMKYEPAIQIPLQDELKKNENAHQVILSIPLFKKGVSGKLLAKTAMKADDGENVEEFVTMDTGSGCVHTAPGHGETDFRVGEHYKLPKPSPVDDEGKLTSDTGEFTGLFVKDADKKIIEYLEERGRLLKTLKVTHSYPLCWRCKTPLIYRLSKQWFLTVDVIKERMLKENKSVKWLPEFAGERFEKWLENANDWAVSVQRFWGIPLPIWICDACGHKDVIGSRKELREKAVEKVDEEIDLHKNSVDKIHLKCSQCGKHMTRVPDTMNVWFDSGISPWASLGYPLKNKQTFEALWPVDMICESQDQIRGWFYSLMFCGVGAFDKKPYNAVSMTGWTLDEKGEKMSKSLGNVVYADDALKAVEADVLRLYYCWSVAPWETQLFSLKIAKELRRVLDVLWNTSVFAESYADTRITGEKIHFKNLALEDKWIISRLNSLIKSTTDDLENFRLHYVGKNFEDFILNDFSRWYIKLIRDRLSPWYEGEDKRTAQFTVLYVLENLVRLMAPVTPFVTEKIYRKLFYSKGRPLSVHLCAWPKADDGLVEKDIEDSMVLAKTAIEAANSLRQKTEIKLKWPVSELIIAANGEAAESALKNMSPILRNMANVEKVVFVKGLEQKEKLAFEHGELALGDVLEDKAFARELMRTIQMARKKEGLNVNERIELWVEAEGKAETLLERSKEMVLREVGAQKLHKGLPHKVGIKGTLEFEGKKVKVYFERAGSRSYT
ncbi:MAG: isoleucine--tRNA ligase [Candidatus Aenigmarchaeota archaeon]|nr:isoleucine--tRNA ligase [Candidatus Aenigmarchaeota archaeon]